jgi:hypothetical protein
MGGAGLAKVCLSEAYINSFDPNLRQKPADVDVQDRGDENENED